MTITGYKATNMDMTGRGGFQFQLNKNHKVDNDKPLKICSDSGLHFCKKLEDVFNYYSWDNCRIFKVETDSEVLTKEDKSICKTLRFVEEITSKEEFKKCLTSKTEETDCFADIILEDDLDFVFRVFRDNKDFEIRRAVVRKLTDLDRINTFNNDVSCHVRAAVAKKLRDRKQENLVS